MKYFKYARRRTSKFSIQVWEELKNLEPYARSIHKGKADMAMLDSYYHITRMYNEEKCTELKHYVIKVLKNIYLGGKSDLVSEEQLNKATDAESMRKNSENDAYEKADIEMMFKNEDLKSCIRYMFPYFIQDFKFFISESPKNMSLDYSDLWDLYTRKTILQTIKVLRDYYKEPVQEYLDKVAKYKRVVRSYDSERYRKSFDETLNFECIIEDTLLLSCKVKVRKEKVVYKINIRKMIMRLMNLMKDELNLEIPELGISVWSSLNGKIFFSEKEIEEQLENEIIGKFLADFISIKVLAYTRGDVIYLVSTKEYPQYIYLDIAEKSFGIELEKVVYKVVK